MAIFPCKKLVVFHEVFMQNDSKVPKVLTWSLPFSSAIFVCFDNEDHKYITIWIHVGNGIGTSSSHRKS